MPRLAADPLTVSAEQREALERLVRTHSTPKQLALRARVILQAADSVGARASWAYGRKRCDIGGNDGAADGQSTAERLADAPKRPTFEPHRIRYWLTPKPDPAFDAKCADVCEV